MTIDRPDRAPRLRRGARWRTTIALLSAAITLAGVAGCRAARQDAPSADASSTSAAAVGTSTHSITVDGRARDYRLYRPASLSLSTPAPLVVMLHGALGTASQAESAYGWNARADREHFVVAYPEGISRSWAVSDGCCGPPVRDGVDDVAFITQLVTAVSGQLPIDARRIYAAGISNGGMLAYRLACDTTVFAAIGPDSATMLGDCAAPAPISIIHIHGDADKVIPYDGGPGKLDNGGTGRNPVRIDGPAVPALIARWRGVDDCGAPEVSVAAPVTTSVATCPDGRAVELITIAGAGHQWPGAKQTTAQRLLNLDPPSTALDATDVIWRFFAAHPKHD